MCRLRMSFILCVLFLFFAVNKKICAEDFTIGTTSAYAPFVSIDEHGDYVGFDIDFARALAEKLNRHLVIKDLGSLPSLFLALKQGKVDALIWAISMTAERQKQVEMIYYQGEKVTSLPLLFWDKIPTNITTIENLVNKPKLTIAVEAGSFQESFLASIPGLQIKYVDKVMDAIMEIRYSKSIATMVDTSLLPTLQHQFPQIKILDVPLPPAEQSFGNGICISKSNQSLVKAIQQAVENLQKEGALAELEHKWGLKEGVKNE